MANSTTLVILSIFLSLFISHYGCCMPRYRFTPWSTFRHAIFPSRDTPAHVVHVPFDAPSVGNTFAAMVRADWRETGAALVMVLDIPGVKRSDVRVEMEENRVMRISGERREEEEEEGEKWHMAERTNGIFSRRFRMPANADLEKVTATVEDGVLRVTVAKKVAEKRT
ncbi:hypothetical protein PHAVU_004G018500 [Phaseolus vulgaris]|uniref:SHSP domain-containing protein n=1 Tax=Phaseolus vulgaris TaxID=3885 RepID=V7BYN8_PHAVU|nr:hypothetical protein PHAVU_004G018500g [Phaseolus vulgaris]ESW23102.1 hypothetical protein PHAVU_004G018500g [Phaseolus vulgaris]